MRYGIVTGAAGALGRALCLKLAQEGWHVLAADVDLKGLQETCAAIEQAGGRADCCRLDVCREEEWLQLRERLQAERPQLDLLANFAGVCASGEVGRLPIAEWDRVLNVNFRGTMLGCHVFVPWLKSHPTRSHLVNMASICGISPFPRVAAYNASKAAVLSLTETLYNELRGTPVTVTAVCPALLRSNLVTGMRHYDEDGLVASSVESILVSSSLTPADVATQTYRAMLRGRPQLLIGLRARALYHLRRLLGGWFLDVYHRFLWPKELRRKSALGVRP